MKKLSSIVLFLMLIFLLIGCNNNDSLYTGEIINADDFFTPDITGLFDNVDSDAVYTSATIDNSASIDSVTDDFSGLTVDSNTNFPNNENNNDTYDYSSQENVSHDEQIIQKESEVWISSSGKKYHNNQFCSNMKSPSKVSEAIAMEKGLEPCKRCYKQ